MTPRALEPDETLCFIHIPKTAGSTLRGVLDARFAAGEICPADDYAALQAYDPAALGRYRLLRGHFWHNISERMASRAVMVTMLRDPIERTISQYEHWKRESSMHSTAMPGTLSLAEYVEHAIAKESIRDVQTRYLAPANQRSASYHQGLAHTHLGVETAKTNLAACAFFGIAESFDRSMRLLSYTLDWDPGTNFEIRNAAVDRLPRARVPAATLERIAELNRNDQELYDFARRLFEERVDNMLASVLEERYRTRRARAVRPVPGARVSADMPLDGEGWYPPEADGQGAYFRWTGPEPTSWLDVPLAEGRGYRIRLVLSHWITTSVRDSLTVQVGPERIQMRKAPGEPYTLVGRVGPAAITEPITRIQLTVPGAHRPIDLGLNGDRRRLGVAVREIEVTATNAWWRRTRGHGRSPRRDRFQPR